MPLSGRPLALLLCFVGLTSLASANCFWPNGTDRNAANNATQGGTLTQDDYVPCNSAAGEVSMCCAVWDQCQANGMCYNEAVGIYWRESCSIQNWNDSPNCIKLFVNDTADVQITPCAGNSSFCYGFDAFDCCIQQEGVFIVNGEQTTHNPNATSSTTSSSTTSTPSASRSKTSGSSSAGSTTSSSSSSSSSSSISASDSTSSSGLSTGAKAGIGVGVTLGALLILGVLAFVLLRRRRETSNIDSDLHQHQEYHHQQQQFPEGEKPAYSSNSPVKPKTMFATHEVGSEHNVVRAEMPIGTERTIESDRWDNRAAELGA